MVWRDAYDMLQDKNRWCIDGCVLGNHRAKVLVIHHEASFKSATISGLSLVFLTVPQSGSATVKSPFKQY